MAGNTIQLDGAGFSAFLRAVPSNRSVLVRGKHGIGKTEFIRDFAEEKGLPICGGKGGLRLGQLEVGDLLGLPYVENGVTKYATPEILKGMFEEPCIVFFDELNRGTKDVQQAVFEIILDRSYHGRALHPDCYVLAAVNKDLDIYTVTEIDPALMSRFAVVDFEPTVAEWLAWGESTGKLSEEIIHVIKQSNQLADPPDAKNVDWEEVQPTRRGWVMFNEMYVKHRDTISMTLIRDWCATFVGKKAAVEFAAVAQDYLRIKKAHSKNMVQANKVGEMLVKHFFQGQWTVEATKNIIIKMDVQQAQAASEDVVEHINSKVKAVTPEFRAKMKVIAEAMPKEVFTRLFKSLEHKIRKSLYEGDKSLYQAFYE